MAGTAQPSREFPCRSRGKTLRERFYVALLIHLMLIVDPGENPVFSEDTCRVSGMAVPSSLDDHTFVC